MGDLRLPESIWSGILQFYSNSPYTLLQFARVAQILRKTVNKFILWHSEKKTLLETLHSQEDLTISRSFCSLWRNNLVDKELLRESRLYCEMVARYHTEASFTYTVIEDALCKIAAETNDVMLIKQILARQSRITYHFGHRDIPQDPERVALYYVSVNPSHVIRHAGYGFHDDFDIVRLIVSQGGWGLRFASERLRNEYKIVGLAVQNWGSALQFASERLKDDERIVRLAIRQDKDAIQFASARLQNNTNARQ